MFVGPNLKYPERNGGNILGGFIERFPPPKFSRFCPKFGPFFWTEFRAKWAFSRSNLKESLVLLGAIWNEFCCAFFHGNSAQKHGQFVGENLIFLGGKFDG